MADLVKQLAEMIQSAEETTKVINKSRSNTRDRHRFKLNLKIEELAIWLRKVSQIVSGDFHDRHTRPIMDEAEQALQKARRFLRSISVFTDFPKMLDQLEDAIRKVKWLIRISSGLRSKISESLPPVAGTDQSKRSRIREQIAVLHVGCLTVQSEAAFSMVLLALDNYQEYLRPGGQFLKLIEEWNLKGDPQRIGKLIVEKDGVKPLLKLLRDGNVRGQENAAIAIGMLGHDMESIEHMVQEGVCSVFVKILKEGRVKVQAIVAWAVSQLAQNFPKWQYHFSQHNIVHLLADQLAFQTLPKHNYNDIARKATSMHDVVMMSNNLNATNNVKGEDDALNNSAVKFVGSIRQEHAVKAYMKAMTAKALWKLAEGNLSICHSIVQSRALLCFALLLEKGEYNVKYNCAMALMEISRVADGDIVTKRIGFKQNSPFFKILVEQTLRMINSARSDILIPCIKTSGNLAILLRAMGVQVVGALVKLLRFVSLPYLSAPDIYNDRLAEWEEPDLFNEIEPEKSWQLKWDIFDGILGGANLTDHEGKMPPPRMMEACLVKDVRKEVLISLTKFSSTDNYLHLKHSKEIITAGGVEPLTKIVSSDDDQFFQISALIILCYVAVDVPHHEELKKNMVITVLEQALKQPRMVDNEALQTLLPDAIAKLKPHQQWYTGNPERTTHVL